MKTIRKIFLCKNFIIVIFSAAVQQPLSVFMTVVHHYTTNKYPQKPATTLNVDRAAVANIFTDVYVLVMEQRLDCVIA